MEVPSIAPFEAVTWGSLIPLSVSETWKTPKGWKTAVYFCFKKLKIYSVSINLSHKNFSFGFTFNMEDEEKLNMEKKEDIKKKEISETGKELNL